MELMQVVAGMPETVRLLIAARLLPMPTAICSHDLAKGHSLFLKAARRSMELEEESQRLRARHLVIGIDGARAEVVKHFNPRNGHAGLDALKGSRAQMTLVAASLAITFPSIVPS